MNESSPNDSDLESSPASFQRTSHAAPERHFSYTKLIITLGILIAVLVGVSLVTWLLQDNGSSQDSTSFVSLSEISIEDGETYYELRNGKLYYLINNKPFNEVEGVDLSSAAIFRKWARDKDDVFYEGYIIEGANPNRFIPLEEPYSMDHKHIYAGTLRIRGVDKETFEILDGFARDKRNVYTGANIVRGADPQTYRDLDGYFAKDENHVYFQDEIINLDVDTASFAALPGGTIKDKRSVYFPDFDAYDRFLPIELADPATFEYVGECGGAEIYYSSYYRDKNNIYAHDDVVEEADPATFHYFGSYKDDDGLPFSVSYAKDTDTVFYGCGDVLREADPNTFIDYKDGYAQDGQFVWSHGRRVEGADPTTFESLGNGYTRDKIAVYYGGIPIEGADIESFTVVRFTDDYNQRTTALGKDKTHVYVFGQMREGVNPDECTRKTPEGCREPIPAP